MVGTALDSSDVLPQAELARLARVLARYLVGNQAGAAATQMAARVAGSGLDFLDFREYQPGDDFRRIDWLASGRSDRVLVRRYSGELSSDWQLCVDASASMSTFDARKWRQASRLAQALAFILLSLGHRVGLILFSDGLDTLCPPGRGAAQYTRITGTLGRHRPRDRGGRSEVGACSRVLARRQPVFVISDFLAEDAMMSALIGLHKRQPQLHLIKVGTREDLQLPETPGLLLEDIESSNTLHCNNGPRAAEAANRRAGELQEKLRAWSQHRHAPLTCCDAEEGWRDVILRHFTGS
jgi:uncharacterized protein (DUF58 family)